MSPTPPLSSIWDDFYCQQNPDDSWRCLRCNKNYRPKHATRAAAHFAKIPKMGIAICLAIIPAAELTRYKNLFDSIVGKANVRKRGLNDLVDDASLRQDSAVLCLAAKKIRTPLSGRGSLDSISSFSSVTASPAKSPNRRNQSSINGLVEKMNQADIRTTINARLEMAIADLMHCENLPDRVVDSPRFKLVLQHARFTDSTFKIPSRKKIGGELLDINYTNCIDTNKETLMADAPTFGLSWLSDGATISRMPLINTLAMCSNIPPTCAAIHDCSDHIAEGGKKDASFIAGLMVESVLKYDPSRMYSDIFFFDGASNVAKAGKVLEAKFPRAYALHGGEHVVSLFFMTCQSNRR